MFCPKCKSLSHKVINTKPNESARAMASIRDTLNCVRRRRECLDCNYRWTTIEEVEERRTS
jgi:transcriptional repressor NrdR